MTSYGILSILPPVVAIGLAIRTKQVHLSLFAGIWLGWTILNGWNPLAGLIQAVELLVQVFADRDRTMIIMLTMLIGAIVTFAQYSGGMTGFVNWIIGRGMVTTRRSAGLMSWSLGFFIFVESFIGVLVAGTVTRPLFDRLKISREKLSYILDSTCSAKAMMVPLNSWGAYIVGLLIAQDIEQPVRVLVTSLPLNFYAGLVIVGALVLAVADRDFGPMAAAQRRVRDEGKLLRDGAEPLVATDALAVGMKAGVPERPLNLVLPMGSILVSLPILLAVTGGGDILQGSGSVSAFWAVIIGLAVGATMYRAQGIMNGHEITDVFMKGVGGMMSVTIVLVLAYSIGDTCAALGTGPFVARAAEAGLSPALVPAVLFVVASITSFATGTSWGTWAIMIPIAMPMVQILGLHPALSLGAVLAGGVFGDHTSPISDSTILSSMASGSDHIDHVRTQLPYALVAVGVALLLYVVVGFAW